MSKENRIPWYKDPKIVVPAITALLAIIVGTIVTFLSKQSSPDFSIIIEPMQGSVRQGGVIQTTITIKGSYGYNHTVSLSASGQPSDVIVTFIPPFGSSKPAYTSTVTMNVNSNVKAGDYLIRIKGTGADGKERTCNYNLNIKPTNITIPPDDLPDKIPSKIPEIKITSPKPLAEVPLPITVSGTLSGEIPDGQFMWIVINPHPSPGQWWPQGGRINPWNGEWHVQARLGREIEDIDNKFDIAAILVNQEDDQYYNSYIRNGQRTGNYPGIPLVYSTKIIDKITVIRK